MRDVIKYYYAKKQQLKAAGQDHTIEYTVAKSMVNAIYGLMVQKIHFDTIVYSDDRDWERIMPDIHTEIGEYERIYYNATGQDPEVCKRRHGAPKIILSPYWGIWVTSKARLRIVETIMHCNEDSIYSDTDSVYIRNYDNHAAWFEAYNLERRRKNMELFGDDYDIFGDLGTFDDITIKTAKSCEKSYSFKTLGAKRYIKFDRHHNVETTIAGLPKRALYNTVVRELTELHGKQPEPVEICAEMVSRFGHNMMIDISDSLKRGTRYNGELHQDVVVDQHGNSELMQERSSVCLYDITFSMRLTDTYLNLIYNDMEG